MPSLARFKPGLMPSLFVLVSLAVLVSLGTWQMQRLAWKTDLISTIESRALADPISLPSAPFADRLNHQAVTVQGLWLAGTEQFVPAKVHERELGEWLLQVMALDDGRQLLINRGWVPLCWREDTCRQPDPATETTVTGILRFGFEQGPMVPDNEPDQARWYWLDVPAIEQALAIGDLVPGVIFAQGAPGDATPPIPQIPALNLRNQHLQYAMTWYSLALVLLGIYGAYGLSRGRTPQRDDDEPSQ
ncbi:MAG: SURF1 family protein [Pseudomonadota bacterium]